MDLIFHSGIETEKEAIEYATVARRNAKLNRVKAERLAVIAGLRGYFRIVTLASVAKGTKILKVI